MSAGTLSTQAQRRFATLAHAGRLERGAGQVVSAEAGRAARGTQVRFYLRLVADRIEQVSYLAYGCPHTLATCEWLAEQLEGRAVSLAAPGEPRHWAAALEVPEEKLGRLLVIEDALSAVLQDGSKISVK